jgi:hypothetical protein
VVLATMGFKKPLVRTLPALFQKVWKEGTERCPVGNQKKRTDHDHVKGQHSTGNPNDITITNTRTHE